MSTALLSCITVTALAGPNRSNCPSLWRCFMAHTYASSSGTAPVRLRYASHALFFLNIDFTSTCYSTFWDFRRSHYWLVSHNHCSLCLCSKGKRWEEAFWLLFCPSDAGQWEAAAWWDAWAHCPQGTVCLQVYKSYYYI